MTQQALEASILLWDCSFREKTHAIDAYLNQGLDASRYEVIWVEFYDCLNPQLKEYQDQYKNFKVICLNKNGDWNYSMCVNAGAQAAQAALLIISDGDVVVPDDFVETELQVQRNVSAKLVNYHRRYDEQHDEQRNILRYRIDLDYLKKVCKLWNPKNYAGCFSVRKKDFVALNGYEEDIHFCGPSAAAKDFYQRACNAGYLIRWHNAIDLFHPYHPKSNSLLYSQEHSQHVIINKRLISREILPNDGLDKSRNKENPDTAPLATVANMKASVPPTIVQSCKVLLKNIYIRVRYHHLHPWLR